MKNWHYLKGARAPLGSDLPDLSHSSRCKGVMMNVFASLRRYLPVGWKHHHFSVCSLPAHQDIVPWRQRETRLFLRQCGGSQQLPKRLRQNQLIILSFRSFQRATEDKSLHDKEKATLVTSLLVSLHLQYHVWFAATKGTCHPPTFCLLCIVYAKNMRSHHKAYRMDTMRHHVYMQQQSSGSLPSTRQMWFEQI